MRRAILVPLFAVPFLALGACGEAPGEEGPGGVTVGEARALDEAAEMLEQRRLPQEALQPAAPNHGVDEPMADEGAAKP